MKVRTVKARYNGNPTQLKIYFGVGQMSVFADMLNVTMTELLSMQDKLKLSDILEMFVLALNTGAKREDKPGDWTTDKVGFLLDDNPGLFIKINTIIGEQMSTIFSDEVKEDDPNG